MNNNLQYFIKEAKILTEAIAKLEKFDRTLFLKECRIKKQIEYLQELIKLISQ